MRAAQKAQAEEFVKLLDQAHREIKRYIENAAFDSAMYLLIQCQQGAIELGNLIESTEGDDTVTIRILERYCEQVYQIHEDIVQGSSVNGSSIYKILHKVLIQIENSIKYDIRVKREAVFLPYKASMWDSLESVWMAADADPDCDAYVIPIPYYDKKPDGSFGERHYEGNEYPGYVPVTDYRAYSLEKRRPDIIFIHNPYDNYNYVTSVEPAFYSGNLKQYTNQLVYIPYFLLGEIDPENEEAVENVGHFCSAPGIMNADKVVVQSEKMRRIYVKNLVRLSGKGGADKRYWESKILGLGSPKIDRVLRIGKEDVEIPDTWMEIIRKPGGDRKKIVLYNTTVTAFLQHEEKMLEKISDVLRTMWENRDEVALLWRPHPLMKATMESMRPYLWRRYEQIVEEYRKEGWGIYDDTADVERAIVLSDVYYGDASSLVPMYQETGKPVMMQTMILSADLEYVRTPFFLDCIWEEDEIVYFPLNYNVLCKTEMKTGSTTIIDRREEKGGYLFVGICKWKNQLILSSYHAGPALYLYDFKSEEWITIPVDEAKHAWLNFREENVFTFGGKLFIFSFALVVLKVDVERKTIEYLFYPDAEPGDDLRGQTVRVGNKIYVPLHHSNRMYVFDLETEQTEVIWMNTEMKGIHTLCFDGKLFWMTGAEKMICSWDAEKNESVSYRTFPCGFNLICEGEEEDMFWFSSSFVFHDSVYFVPCYANMFLEMALEKKEIKEIVIAGEGETKETIERAGRNSVAKFGVAKRKDQRLLLYSSKNKNLILMDLETKKTDTIRLQTAFAEQEHTKPGASKRTDDIETDIGKLLGHVSRKETDVRKEKKGDRIYAAVCNGQADQI